MHRPLASLLAAALCASFGIGCGSAGSDSVNSVDATGSVGLELVTGGVTIAQIGYTIVGPKGYRASDSIDAQNSTTISSLIGGIPAGAGYTITLSTIDVFNPAIICSGSAAFDIVAGMTSSAQVHITCKVPPGKGSVQINGSINVCPTITSLSIDPLEVTVTHPIKLATRATDPDGPSPLKFTYTATGGKLYNSDIAFAVLECTAPGPVTITIVVSDGDSTCDVSASQTVTCSP